MRNILMICIFILLSVHSSEASDWELFADSQNNEYYIDKQSIEEYEMNCSWHYCTSPQIDFSFMKSLPKKFVRVWVKKTNKNPGKYDVIDEMDYLEYECKEKRTRMLHLTKIYSDMINESVDLSAMSRWNDIRTGTVVKLIYDYLCKNNSKYLVTSLSNYRADAQFR
jgi:hypothetical protein